MAHKRRPPVAQMKAGQEKGFVGAGLAQKLFSCDCGMGTYSSLASSYSSLRTQLSHHLLQEDHLNCPPPLGSAGLETPPLGFPSPSAFPVRAPSTPHHIDPAPIPMNHRASSIRIMGLLYMPGTELWAGPIAVNSTNDNSCPHRDHFLVRGDRK